MTARTVPLWAVRQNREYQFASNLQDLQQSAILDVQFADVAELADAIDLGSIACKGVEVRVLSSAPDRDSQRGPVA